MTIQDVLEKEQRDRELIISLRQQGEISGEECMQCLVEIGAESDNMRDLLKFRSETWDLPLDDFFFELDGKPSEDDREFMRSVKEAMRGKTFRECLNTSLDGILDRDLEEPCGHSGLIGFWKRYPQELYQAHLYLGTPNDYDHATMLV